MTKSLKTRYILMCISILMCSVLSLLLGSLAWYNSIRAADTATDNFTAKSTGLIESVSIYRHRGADTSSTDSSADQFESSPLLVCTFGERGDAPSVTYTAPKYDNDSDSTFGYFSLSSLYHTLLYVVKFREDAIITDDTDVAVTLSTDIAWINALANLHTGTDGTVYNQIQKTSNPLSSVVEFRSAALSAAVATVTDDSGTSYLDLSSSSSSYLTPTGKTPSAWTDYWTDWSSFYAVNSDTSDSRYDYSESGYRQEFDAFESMTASTSSDGTTSYTANYSSFSSAKYVAVEAEYCPDSVTYIYSLNIGNDTISNDVLRFYCDYKMSI